MDWMAQNVACNWADLTLQNTDTAPSDQIRGWLERRRPDKKLDSDWVMRAHEGITGGSRNSETVERARKELKWNKNDEVYMIDLEHGYQLEF